jgi:hypothetical protein
VDEAKVSQYRLSSDDKDYSLTHLMSNCADFVNEMLQLQFVCHSLGAEALTTTKYHAYAGEGVKYSWGGGKSTLLETSTCLKKGKTNFDALVATCISRDVLTKELIQKISHQARSYMVTYKTLEISKDQSESGSNITLNKIENTKKVIKSHRAALDFDKDFIMKSITANNFNFEQEVKKDDTVRNEGSRTRKRR